MEFFVSGYQGDKARSHEARPKHPYKEQADNAPPANLQVAGDGDYAGDVTPAYAYDVLKAEEDAVLIDVRTKPEWGFVGVPDLSDIGKPVGFIEWLSFPQMSPNPQFLPELSRFVDGNDQGAVFFLCRSGQRSQKAAIAATTQGFARAYNIEGGFEGTLDQNRHRGALNGWKAAGLPWAQS